MKAMLSLIGSRLRTYNGIFQHPVSHKLSWDDVPALFGRPGQIEDEPNGHLKETRNGQTLVLHLPHAKDVTETSEVKSLRQFLEKSDTLPPEIDGQKSPWLLVIDRHDARICLSEMGGAVPLSMLAQEPEALRRLATDAKDFSRGKSKPGPNSFFKPVANVLPALQHPDQARHIIGSMVVDEHRLTEDQLLARARKFYTTAAKADNESANNPGQSFKKANQTKSKEKNAS
jgi:hypothetical protein